MLRMTLRLPLSPRKEADAFSIMYTLAFRAGSGGLCVFIYPGHRAGRDINTHTEKKNCQEK